jgi:PHD/YefM family antitoxin component YafN of YafNO toxin-antitoxin module
MKNSQLNRVLSLVRKTGDKVIVLDPETEETIVLMSFDEYEALSGISYTVEKNKAREVIRENNHQNEEISEQKIEQKNQIIPNFSANFSKKESSSENPLMEEVPKEKSLNFEGESWVVDGYGDMGGAEEDLGDLPEEEKFYLEPVE